MAENALDSFLTPEAMLTPGAAGSITMMITNALGASFGAPQALTALAFSFICGVLVWASTGKNWWVKGIYYVLNSLVIFCVALGTNSFGVAQTRTVSGPSSHIGLSIIGLAIAQTPAPAPTLAELQARRTGLDSEYADTQKKIDDALKAKAPAAEIAGLKSTLDELNTQRQKILDQMLADYAKETGNAVTPAGGKKFFQPWQLPSFLKF